MRRRFRPAGAAGAFAGGGIPPRWRRRSPCGFLRLPPPQEGWSLAARAWIRPASVWWGRRRRSRL